jgi:hypothetical protein
MSEFSTHLETLADHWVQLDAATGSGAGGRSASGSRPPAKLSVVSLVSEVAAAAREGAEELGRLVRRRPGPHPIENLWLIHGALLAWPDDDQWSWWSDAVVDWDSRVSAILAHSTERLYGAVCPNCGNLWARMTQDGWTSVRVPAIEVVWDGVGVHRIWCRHCYRLWERDDNLSELADRVLRTSATLETLAV